VSADSVTLRPLSPDDRDEFLGRMYASRGLHHPWAVPLTETSQWHALLARTRGEDFEALVVCLGGGDIAGYFNLSQIFRGAFQSAYLGYAAFAPFDGRGYMTEGLRLLLRHAFAGLRLHRLEANIQPGNVRSIELVRRCGFRLEGFSPRYLKINGRWRDHERWAITAEDWRRG
jgi:ribosomal-protein-alanine N-acetyltransferase